MEREHGQHELLNAEHARQTIAIEDAKKRINQHLEECNERLKNMRRLNNLKQGKGSFDRDIAEHAAFRDGLKRALGHIEQAGL